MTKIIFKKGMNVRRMIAELSKLPQSLPIYVSSDEEQNCLYNGCYLDVYEDGIAIAGLSGTERGY